MGLRKTSVLNQAYNPHDYAPCCCEKLIKPTECNACSSATHASSRACDSPEHRMQDMTKRTPYIPSLVLQYISSEEKRPSKTDVDIARAPM
jgi:hypothetical protein